MKAHSKPITHSPLHRASEYKMKTIVISLGGSILVPNEINIKFLDEFKKFLKKHEKRYKFIIITGGGSIARKYISALKDFPIKTQSMIGIAVTRLNARFLTYFLGKDTNDTIPQDMHQVKSLLTKNNIVVCGALRYAEKETSDSTSAKLAHFLKAEFINMTNVPGLFTKDPRKFKDAKLIQKISWKKFHAIAKSLKYEAGQHFVLDQHGAEIIKKHKIKTYIINSNIKNLENLIQGKKFTGTVIFG
ncbi:UMP kinase [Candidatus Pacearchaeota archaeon]|nr:UMP kinase [Candidatus Pacearchaeota archaeon]